MDVSPAYSGCGAQGLGEKSVYFKTDKIVCAFDDLDFSHIYLDQKWKYLDKRPGNSIALGGLNFHLHAQGGQ